MKPYASDLSDERWALIEPMLTAWRTAHPSVSGHQGRYGLCEIVNALLQQSRTGCQRNLLPHDLPPRRAVFYRYAGGVRMARTRPSTTCRAFRCGRKKGRSADPSLVVLDTQSVRTATTTGRDAAKQMPGRKRGPAMGILRHLLRLPGLSGREGPARGPRRPRAPIKEAWIVGQQRVAWRDFGDEVESAAGRANRGSCRALSWW
ncbi:transposase [Nonomuraea sp. NPDC059007]|uniref:transposase n=1 Tax=Nonomuraea sp. NPDC059007 TaxID=3346692 RepID=UPI0036A66D4A